MYTEIAKAVFQILVITVAIYKFYDTLSNNMSGQVVKSAATYIVVYLVCRFTGLVVLETLLRLLILPYTAFLCILYQPELRRAFAPGFSTRRKFFKLGGVQTTVDSIDSIISACQHLAQVKRGALIVFPRNVSIKNIIETGTRINADITTALITTVFDHDTPLHDGAMIIQGPKIVAAGCYLPLSSKTDIQSSFGTRHRAAIGMAEASDAIVLVVSEETCSISLAYNGNLYYNLDTDSIRSTLIALFNNLEINLENLEVGDES